MMIDSAQRRSGRVIQTVTIDGKRFVILSEAEYCRLAGEPPEPDMPAADASGNYPAAEALRVSIVREIIRDRRRLGLTQAELARRAGIRPETLNRIEQGANAPSVATVDKIDRALKQVEAERSGRSQMPGAAGVKRRRGGGRPNGRRT